MEAQSVNDLGEVVVQQSPPTVDSINIDVYTVSTNPPPHFIFPITLSKLADFNAFLCGNSRENWTLTVYIFDRLTYLL